MTGSSISKKIRRTFLSVKLALLGFGGLILLILLWDYDLFSRRLALVMTVVFSGIIYLVVYLYLARKFQIILPAFTALAIVLGVLLDAMGNFLHLYGNVGWWDDVAHFLGTAMVTIVIFTILYLLNKERKIKVGKFAMGFFTVSVSMLLATFYEITEYWGDLVFKIHRIGEHYDTVSDLNWNFFGALLVVILGFIFFRKRKNR